MPKKKKGRMTIHFIKTPGSVGLKPTMTQPYDSIAQDTSSGSPSGKPESAADVRKCEQASHKPTSALVASAAALGASAILPSRGGTNEEGTRLLQGKEAELTL